MSISVNRAIDRSRLQPLFSFYDTFIQILSFGINKFCSMFDILNPSIFIFYFKKCPGVRISFFYNENGSNKKLLYAKSCYKPF